MIKKCCENCALGKTKNNQYCFKCLNDEFENPNAEFFNRFIPKEELVRQDERKNIVDDILNSNFYIEDDNKKTYEIILKEI